MRRSIWAVLLLLFARAHAGAAQSFQALVQRANVADSTGDHVAAFRLYEQLYAMSGFDPTGLALAAMQAARAGLRDDAFRDLRRAIDGGMLQPRLLDDSAFIPLRHDPRWPAVVAGMQQRIGRLDQPLRQELLALADSDQRNRQGFGDVMVKYGRNSPEGDSAVRALGAADAPVQARLRAIIAQHGWPTRTLVADDGAHAAWLVVQHMPLAYQRVTLPRLLVAVAHDEARAGDGALLQDRVLVGSKQPQVYGTQLANAPHGGVPVLDPIANESCVDVRRKRVGLEPLSAYLSDFGVTYTKPQRSDAECGKAAR